MMKITTPQAFSTFHFRSAVNIELDEADARDRFYDLLNQSQRGDVFLITRAGMPIARIVPISRDEFEAPVSTVTELPGQ